MSRVAIPVAGDGTLSDFHGGPAADPIIRQYKQRLANLALLCLAYLTSPGIEVERVEAPPAVAKRRAREGKSPLPDYYICRLAKGRRYATEGEPTGNHVSFRFDVAGHFRRLSDGRTIWVRPHQRGLQHEIYKPKVYRIDPDA
jgi:hypothetical protein